MRPACVDEAMGRLTYEPQYAEYAARFARQAESAFNARRAFAAKAAFGHNGPVCR